MHFCRHLFQPVQPTTSSDDDSSLGLISEMHTNAANLRMVHMSLACVKRIICETSTSAITLDFRSLPPIVLAMLQMKRFTTLVAAALDIIKTTGQNSQQLHEQLVLHSGFLDALKGYLDDDQLQTRVVTLFANIAEALTQRGLQQFIRAKIVKALFNALSNFRVQDSGLQQAMQSTTAVFNFAVVKGVLRASRALLQVRYILFSPYDSYTLFPLESSSKRQPCRPPHTQKLNRDEQCKVGRCHKPIR